MSDDTNKDNVVSFKEPTQPPRFSNRLLISEHPLQVLPSLATKIGLNEALMLQQIHYWITNELNQNIKNGRVWVYNTHRDWKKQFPFWSLSTIERIIASLESNKLIISGAFNKLARDRTKWYTIDYEKLDSLEVGTFRQNDVLHDVNMTRSISSKCRNALPEITTETSTDINKKINKKSFDIEFEEFWSWYPKKVDKQKTLETYRKILREDYGLHAVILSALCGQVGEREIKARLGIWQPDVKGPAGWLNAKRWEDEVKTEEQLREESKRNQSGATRQPSRVEQTYAAINQLEQQAIDAARRAVIRDFGEDVEGGEDF